MSSTERSVNELGPLFRLSSFMSATDVVPKRDPISKVFLIILEWKVKIFQRFEIGINIYEHLTKMAFRPVT